MIWGPHDLGNLHIFPQRPLGSPNPNLVGQCASPAPASSAAAFDVGSPGKCLPRAAMAQLGVPSHHRLTYTKMI
jgi:hypothetical protein